MRRKFEQNLFNSAQYVNTYFFNLFIPELQHNLCHFCFLNIVTDINELYSY